MYLSKNDDIVQYVLPQALIQLVKQIRDDSNVPTLLFACFTERNIIKTLNTPVNMERQGLSSRFSSSPEAPVAVQNVPL